MAAAIAGHRADIVHLASPFVLGVRGMAAAARLGVPAVAVYQTDLAGYARTYMGAGEAAAWRRIRSVHGAADLTLAPSSAALRDLEAHG
ncbi:glycosyltransferase, partial [Streptomyces rochei]|uniref:glycosyltransferase n=1 Tax=Streptomyces rochei TaxID=1928 RepID=UPI003A59955D